VVGEGKRQPFRTPLTVVGLAMLLWVHSLRIAFSGRPAIPPFGPDIPYQPVSPIPGPNELTVDTVDVVARVVQAHSSKQVPKIQHKALPNASVAQIHLARPLPPTVLDLPSSQDTSTHPHTLYRRVWL
jgi:hypothetical protein